MSASPSSRAAPPPGQRRPDAVEPSQDDGPDARRGTPLPSVDDAVALGLTREEYALVVDKLGRFAGDPDAYTYLPASVKRFPDAPSLAALMHEIGLRDVGWILTAGGIIALHHGTPK